MATGVSPVLALVTAVRLISSPDVKVEVLPPLDTEARVLVPGCPMLRLRSIGLLRSTVSRLSSLLHAVIAAVAVIIVSAMNRFLVLMSLLVFINRVNTCSNEICGEVHKNCADEQEIHPTSCPDLSPWCPNLSPPRSEGLLGGGGERKIIGESQRIRRAWRGRMNDLLPLFVQFTALVPSVSSVVNPS